MPWILLQVLLLLFIPFAARRLERLKVLPTWLSPVVFCYAIGIAISNFHLFPLQKHLSTSFSEYAIVLAIPLLLYNTRLKTWMNHARSTLTSFGLCVGSGIIASSMAAWFYKDQLSESWQLAGMLAGIYTGGTPNMQAIGLSLNAPQATIILVNAADIFWGGIYLLFLTSFGPRVFEKILPYTAKETDDQQTADLSDSSSYPLNYSDVMRSILLTILILLISAGSCYLIFGDLRQVSFLMLMLTTLSIIATFIPRVQRLESTFETGEYFLLIFCVAIGMLADFSEIRGEGMDILFFTGITLLITILLHLLMAYFFRIERDLFMFTSVAALYGPAFIGQISSITHNRQLIFSGISMGLLGYAIGNYLGIGLAYLLKLMF